MTPTPRAAEVAQKETVQMLQRWLGRLDPNYDKVSKTALGVLSDEIEHLLTTFAQAQVAAALGRYHASHDYMCAKGGHFENCDPKDFPKGEKVCGCGLDALCSPTARRGA